jgi:hypothetical protein
MHDSIVDRAIAGGLTRLMGGTMNHGIVSHELLEQFYNHITAGLHNGQYCYGLELEFCDRNDFDVKVLAFQYNDFSWWLNDVGSPLSVAVTDRHANSLSLNSESVKNVAVQFRNFIRNKFGKPPLKNEEVAGFIADYQFLINREKRPAGFGSLKPYYRVDDKEVHAATEYALEKYEYVAKYIKSLKYVAPLQGYSCNAVNGMGMPFIFAEDALMGTLPPLDGYGGIDGVQQVVRLLQEI